MDRPPLPAKLLVLLSIAAAGSAPAQQGDGVPLAKDWPETAQRGSAAPLQLAPPSMSTSELVGTDQQTMKPLK
ncbi:MAG TPA: hypothetical protein VIN03_09310 [Roseateles sp.]